MTPNEVLSKYEGKTVGYPDNNSFYGECLSLTKWIMRDCYGFMPPASGANAAYGYWTNFPSPLGEYFTKVKKTKEAIILPGDFPIWNSNVGGGAGHIAYCIRGGVDDFISLDQNWKGKQAHRVTHNFSNILGWLHPKETMADTIAVDKATFEKLVTKSTYYDEFVKIGVKQASDIEDLKRDVKQAQANEAAAQQEARDSRTALADYQQQVAQKLNSAQDLARVLSAIQELLDSEKQATTNGEKDALKMKEYEVTITDLKAEINRLQLELKANKSLDTATALEMLMALINRFKRLLNTM